MRTLVFLIAFALVAKVFAQSANQCTTNADFEQSNPGAYTASNSVAGWSLSSAPAGLCTQTISWTPGVSAFSVVSTPVAGVPYIGILGHSPLGGTMVAKLNDYTTAGVRTRMSRTFNVTSTNALFTYAFAGIFEGHPGEGCCDGSGLEVQVRDCLGSMLTCAAQSINPACTNSVAFTYSAGVAYTNWQVRQIDLSSSIGSCVTIDFFAHGCAFNGDPGMAFVDVLCVGSLQQLNPPLGVSFCQGPALLQATPGYSAYAWGNVSGTLTGNINQSYYYVSNPQVGAVYHATLTNHSGCTTVQTFTLAPSQVTISSLGATPSCSLGSSGSATVVGTGNGSGYSYTWTNSSNSVVSTASVAQNLAPGIYSVQLSAPGTTACGVAAATLSVGNDLVTTQTVAKPFCGTTAYFTTNGGSNHKWYSGTTAITGTAGTAPSLTVSSPSNGSIIRLRYTSAQGCNDSIIYVLWQATPAASVTAQFNSMVCQYASNGQATINLSPAGSSQVFGNNAFHVVSTGTTPSYSASTSMYTSNQYTVGGLSGGGSYSVTAFDGSCYTNNSFVVPTFYTSNLFSITTVGSPSICQGQSLVANAGVQTNPQAYTYSWSPLTFMGNGNAASTLITPTVNAGSSLSIVYTVVVTPTLVNCPSARTLQVVVSNPLVPSVAPIPPLCDNSSTISAGGFPIGGVFTGGSFIDSSGVITPSLANLGANTFSYSVYLNNCPGVAASGFMLLQAPQVTAMANTTVCSGAPATLTAAGATNYQWAGIGNGSLVVVNPTATTIYTVFGTTNNSCTGSDTILLNVTPQPTASVTGNMPVCAGQTLVLKASGAQKLIWLNGPGSPYWLIAPTTTGNYTLLGVNNPGQCVDTLVVTVTVSPNPSLTVQGPHSACSGDMIVLVGSGAPNLVWTGQTPGATYSAVISASQVFTLNGTNAQGCAAQLTYSVYADVCRGLTVSHQKINVQLFPNPADESFTVILEKDAQLRLYDAQGRLVKEMQCFAGAQTILMSGLGLGVYSVVLSDDSSTEVFRLIKN